MSAVPNRYYNSPWIADAGRNLAAALAPADPEKTLLAQQNAWKFDRAQELARMEDEEYAQKGVRQQALGDIITAQGAPEEGTGYPDQTANDAAIDAALQKAIQAGVPINDAMLAAGTRSRKYMQQHSLAEDRFAAQAGNLDRRLDQTLDIFTATEAGRNARAGQTDDRIRDLAAILDQQRRDIAAANEKGKNERDANGGGTALDISPTDDLNLGYAVDDWATKFGVSLPQDQYRAFKSRAAQIYQNTRNSTTAVEQAGREFFGDKPSVNPARDPWGPGDEEDYPATLNLRDNMSVGAILAELAAKNPAPAAAGSMAGAVAPVGSGVLLPGAGPLIPGAAPPAAAAPAAAAPAGAGPQEGQRATDKKGRKIIFMHGRWELE